MAEGSFVTQKTFYGDGTQKVFNFAMDYLRKPFITVKVNGGDQAYGVDYTVVDQEVHMTIPPEDGVKIVIQRKTTTDRLVVWADASVLRASDLTLFEVQLLHLQEETNDAVQTDVASLTLQAELARDEAVSAKGSALVNASTATLQATIATTKASEAQGSASSALASKNSAESSATSASGSASTATSQATIATTKAGEALTSASNAEDSEVNAKLQADRAEALLTGHTVIVPTFPIGAPFPWFSSTRPDGTLLCNGQSFSLTAYPKLALVYPTGVLPDMRGVVPRGLDRGKGLDMDGSGRALASYQADDTKAHVHSISATVTPAWNAAGGSITVPIVGGTTTMNTNTAGGTETRMKNIACDWLVYAVTMDYDLTINNGNAVTLGGYPVSHFASVEGSRTWLSAPFTPDPGVHSFTHGLTFSSIDIVLVDCILECLTADAGYTVGDRVFLADHWNVSSSPSYATPLSPCINTTTVSVAQTVRPTLSHKTTGVALLVTNSTYWRMRIRIRY